MRMKAPRQKMEKIDLLVSASDAGLRIDRFLADACNLSRAMIQQLLAAGHILVNDKIPQKSYKLEPNDRLEVQIPPPAPSAIEAQDISLEVVFEDADILVVNKPKGMVVHPAPGNPDGTLVNALLYHCGGSLSGIGGELRPGIVHRIDKDTSGLLVVAKNDAAHAGLSAQFAQHSIERRYQAVVYGRIKEQEGRIEAPIGRDQHDRKRMAVTDWNSKTAVTTYKLISEFEGFSHLQLRLMTGRTHQIRVHMAHIAHPVAGDAVYGPKKVIRRLEGQCLHAKTLGFIHPITGEALSFNSPLPEYFVSFLSSLKPLY